MASDTDLMFESWKTLLKSFKKEKKLYEFLLAFGGQSYKALSSLKKKPLGSELLRKIYLEEDPLALVLKAHLIIEIVLDEIIRKKFRYGNVLLKRKDVSFSLKKDILRSKNYLDLNLHSDIRLLNDLRNKYAHDYFYDIADFDMSKFYYCDRLYDGVPTKRAKTKRLINLKTFQFFVLVYLLTRLTKKFPFIADIKIKKIQQAFYKDPFEKFRDELYELLKGTGYELRIEIRKRKKFRKKKAKSKESSAIKRKYKKKRA